MKKALIEVEGKARFANDTTVIAKMQVSYKIWRADWWTLDGIMK
jgi:hypothetical protein